ncbi:hypothetical protein [Desulfohalovibrio reitneri]|uniref:hypothetical protein n=1 Tax=Desulfohalovibrio reitneri TaxID=1307759 RepID=UPI0004A6C94E|nr:hypothetical protein [Desulfohalovibrio reitneri]
MPKLLRRGQVVDPEEVGPEKETIQEGGAADAKSVTLNLTAEGYKALLRLKVKHPDTPTSCIVSAALVLAAKQDKTKIAGSFDEESIRKMVEDELEVGPARLLAEGEQTPAEQRAEKRASKAGASPPPPQPASEEAGEGGQVESSGPRLADMTAEELAAKKKSEGLSLDEKQAYRERVLLRLYTLYRQGQKPEEIAKTFNQEGLPPIEDDDAWDGRGVRLWLDQEVLPRKMQFEMKMGREG